jgi:hypothetical protein
MTKLIAKMMTVRQTPMVQASPTCPSSKAWR